MSEPLIESFELTRDAATGDWHHIAKDSGIIIDVNLRQPPHLTLGPKGQPVLDEYETLTLRAINTVEGAEELLTTAEDGPQIRIKDNWFAWGNVDFPDENQDLMVFTLARMTI